MSDLRKILVVRLSSLGDLLHTIPACQSLRTAFPDARIDWLVERKLAFLLDVVEGLDEVIPIDTLALRSNLLHAEGWRQLLGPMRRVRAQRYDTAIDFQGLLKTAFLSFVSGAATRIGFSKHLVRERPAHWFYHRAVSGPGCGVHVARLNLLLSQAAGAPPVELQAHLRTRDQDAESVARLLSREQLSEFIVINPGGGWPNKCWHPARYGALAARIDTELQLRVIIVTGPGEASIYQEIASHCTARLPAHFQIPFLQLIPLFRKARLLISGDTGPLHLACALHTPVVAIMGPTSPVRNGPWLDRDEVVVRRLPCSFCHMRSCPTMNECMDISVDEVFAAVVRRLERSI